MLKLTILIDATKNCFERASSFARSHSVSTSTHHCAALQHLQRGPVVADGLVPEHALVPHLDEQASVEVAELAKKK